MSLDFTSAAGHLFNRLGAIFAAIGRVQTYQGTTVATSRDNIAAQFTTAQQLVPTLQTAISSGQTSAQGLSTSLGTLASNILIDMVQADNPQPAATLNYALPELIRQMTAASASVVQNVVTATATAATTNTGTGTVLISAVDDAGLALENILAESVQLVCTSDALPGNGATAGQEQFTIRGDASAKALDFLWPLGSGATTSFTAVSADVQAANQNVLTNSNFETWTNTNTLSSWTVSVGVYGTDIVRTTSSFTGTYALCFKGDGSTLSRIYQTLRNSGTLGIVQPQTKYALSVMTAVSAVPAAGVLKVSLKDTVAGTVIGATTITLTGETTAFARHTAVFNTPLNLSGTLTMVAELTTALSNTKNVYIDEMVLTKMTQWGNGAFISVLRGATNFIRGDAFTVTTTNTRAGSFQEWFNRCYGMDKLGLLLPSNNSSSATIPNSLIA